MISSNCWGVYYGKIATITMRFKTSISTGSLGTFTGAFKPIIPIRCSVINNSNDTPIGNLNMYLDTSAGFWNFPTDKELIFSITYIRETN